MTRVRIFVDYDYFSFAWKGLSDCRSNWAKLPKVISERLVLSEFIDAHAPVVKGVFVYASIHPDPGAAQERFNDWLRFNLSQQPGYTVRLSERRPVVQSCAHGHKIEHYISKGLDTRITCDLISFATRNTYDLGVLVSGDSDLIPAVDFVQESLDKKIVHIGGAKGSQALRCSAWGHILLDDLVPELEIPKSISEGVARDKN